MSENTVFSLVYLDAGQSNVIMDAFIILVYGWLDI